MQTIIFKQQFLKIFLKYFLQLISICHYFIVIFLYVWSLGSRGKKGNINSWSRMVNMHACFDGDTRNRLKALAFNIYLAS